MEQQTSVEWLKSKVLYIVPSSQKDDLLRLFEAANQMDKEQKEYFFECGRNFQLTGEGTFEQRYDETYKK